MRPGAAALAILLAEDNEINALLARACWSSSATGRASAPSGAAAVAAFVAARGAGAPFDLVLMDLHMPGMTASKRRAASAPRSERAAHRTPDHRADRGCSLPKTAMPASPAGMDAFLDQAARPRAVGGAALDICVSAPDPRRAIG